MNILEFITANRLQSPHDPLRVEDPLPPINAEKLRMQDLEIFKTRPFPMRGTISELYGEDLENGDEPAGEAIPKLAPGPALVLSKAPAPGAVPIPRGLEAKMEEKGPIASTPTPAVSGAPKS